MKKILIVIGTRPEAIKMYPLLIELKKRDKFDVRLCVTGQHRELLESVLELFDIVPEYDLRIMTNEQTLFDVTSRVLNGLKEVIEDYLPDLVIVHGDTTTAYASALAAFYMKVTVAHVEAGLRTQNILEPFPEEYNRKAISVIAKFHFAPTQEANNNLLQEGKCEKDIYVTGNTVIDTIKNTIKKDYQHQELDWAKDSTLILMTVHRRENMGEPLCEIFRAILEIVEEYKNVKVIYPIHKNPSIRQMAYTILGNHPRIHIIEPLIVSDFHNFINNASFVITDSGGVQEEAIFLKKRVLVLRRCTERPEGVKCGISRVIGVEYEKIVEEIRYMLSNQSKGDFLDEECPFGIGNASEYIADILEKEL